MIIVSGGSVALLFFVYLGWIVISFFKEKIDNSPEQQEFNDLPFDRDDSSF